VDYTSLLGHRGLHLAPLILADSASLLGHCGLRLVPPLVEEIEVELGGHAEELELGAPKVGGGGGPGGQCGERGRGIPVGARVDASCAWRCPEAEPPAEHVILVDAASSPAQLPSICVAGGTTIVVTPMLCVQRRRREWPG
jgi:hypothetical protein